MTDTAAVPSGREMPNSVDQVRERNCRIICIRAGGDFDAVGLRYGTIEKMEIFSQSGVVLSLKHQISSII